MIEMNKIKDKIKIIYFLLKCLLTYLKYGSAKNKFNGNIKTVLICQLAWLGDVVCTTPVFAAVKEKYPDCRVIVLGNKRNTGLLDNHPHVDKYVVWEDDFDLLKNNLVSEKIDFACITSPTFIGLAYLYLLRIPIISVPTIKNGFSPYETVSFKLLRFVAHNIDHVMGNYAPREYLRLLEPINIFSDNTKKILKFSKNADNKIVVYIDSLKLNDSIKVIISPSAGNKAKNWRAENFSKVADYLISKYNANVFVIGSKSDEIEIKEMISKSANSIKIINAISLFSLDELKAFISKANLFISVDTGPIYIAEAFDIPTIDLVGAMDENEQPPQGDKHISIVSPDRPYPTIHIMNSRVFNYDLARKAIDDITPEMVYKAIDDILIK